MSKIFRRSSCQKASDGTDGALRQSARGLPLAPEKTGTSMSRRDHLKAGRKRKREVAKPCPGWDGFPPDQADLGLCQS